MKTAQQTKNPNLRLKYLAISVVSSLSLLVAPSVQADVGQKGKVKQIGDLEIYSEATGSTAPRLLLMLDMSHSMWAASHPDPDKAKTAGETAAIPLQENVDADDRMHHNYAYGYVQDRCFLAYDPIKDAYQETKDTNGNTIRIPEPPLSRKTITTYTDTKSYTYKDQASGKKFTVTLPTDYNKASRPHHNPIYGLSGCVNRNTGQKSQSRIAILKDALLTMLSDNTLSDNIYFGIATYPALKTSKPYERYRNGKLGGDVIVPVKQLTFEHRKRLMEAIAWLNPHGGTPISPMLAEAGAYMLGTTTLDRGRPLTAQLNFFDTANLSIIPKENFGIVRSSERYEDITTAYTSQGVHRELNPATDNYIKAGKAECGARNGIYIMTDGLPNRGGANVLFAMNNSLQGSSYKDDKGNLIPMSNSNLDLSDPDNPGLSDFNDEWMNKYHGGTGYQMMSLYAKRLNEGKTPNGTSIQVATGGLGDLFDGMHWEWATDENGNKYKDYQCDAPLIDASTDKWYKEHTEQVNNICRLGRKKGKYGQGGFSHLTDSQSIINSIAYFIGSKSVDIPTKPSGTIVVPKDPLSTSGPQPIAYLPMMEPKPNTMNSVWKGNVKKYKIENGTLYGKDRAGRISLLFDNALDEAKLNSLTIDYWSDKDYPTKNAQADSGGFYANLRTPFSKGGGIASVRTVYVEDNGTLKQFSVNSAGKILVDGRQLNDGSFSNTKLYNVEMIKKLLMFLGFDRVKGDYSKKEYTIQNIPVAVATFFLFDRYLSLMPPSEPRRTVGASPHSAPVTISYGADAKSDPKTHQLEYENRDDYLLFGSMDGALHLVDADDYGINDGGQEKFAILTETMLTTQPEAIVPNSTNGKMGIPYFGVDAPWAVKQSLDDNITTDAQGNLSGSVSNNGDVVAYGGFRMGAEGLYAIDITNANKSNAPRLKFKLQNTGVGSDFERLGQIWSAPTIAKVKLSDSASDKGTDVLIFGGGYDTCYEDQTFQVGNRSFANGRLRNQRNEQCRGKLEAVGNAVYMVNAKTGDLIWSTKGMAGSDNLKHSIVGGVVPLDANNDGYVDNIYFADLGGQLFRVDFLNAGDEYKQSSAVNAELKKATNFSGFRLTRLYQDKTVIKKFVRRFYGTPAVSIQQASNYNNGELFASINIASGDRSSPLSKIRRSKENADRVYGILDTDITKPVDQLYDPKFTGMDDSNIVLIDLDKTRADIRNGTRTTDQVRGLVRATNGWYYPFIGFDGYTNVFFTKAVGGKSEILANNLYMSVYNPNMEYGTKEKDANAINNSNCTSGIKGGSEVRRYCLPFGICDDSVTKDGVGGYQRLGKGLQELIMGPRGSNDDHRKQLMILGVQKYDPSKRVQKEYGKSSPEQSAILGQNQRLDGLSPVAQDNNGVGGLPRVPPAPKDTFYALVPKIWYNSSVVEEKEKKVIKKNQ